MNFLAHALLSGNDPLVRAGNFVGDSVKGSQLQHYPVAMQKGILLHRFIDSFTDTHSVVHESKSLLRQRFGKYAGVVADVIYDHYLARNWDLHHDHLDLSSYAKETYSILQTNFEQLPERSKEFLPYMIRQDWLSSYKTREGISLILLRMSKRTGFVSGMEKAEEELEERDHIYEEHFSRFFPELRLASELELDRLNQLQWPE
ncbi:MAG TPA: DUF479 domain-containing protein [Flavobacteriales bacterium]|nr:DUF479 domain-containing protein [Flavobacteriales bacterium]HRE75948.1 ACP phosphodiesterase [Flavobacteriales bacterium]HRE98105.1 ACP phosphodiesterase [Flavobacteriales bacterium]HRJ36991.1 ACP phosphodiesterase [Flavobacteriales bacterium]HRJ39088.1 ACP phosphodiesterase [Flavobacteriales bacterium]